MTNDTIENETRDQKQAKLDMFAAFALQTVWSGSGDFKAIATACYDMAEFMMEERGTRDIDGKPYGK